MRRSPQGRTSHQNQFSLLAQNSTSSMKKIRVRIPSIRLGTGRPAPSIESPSACEADNAGTHLGTDARSPQRRASDKNQFSWLHRATSSIRIRVAQLSLAPAAARYRNPPHSLACLRWKVFQREVVALSSSTVDNFSHGQLEGAVTPANERKLNAKSVTRSLQQP